MNLRIQHTANRINSWILPMLAFCLPVSTSAVTVFALLIVVLWFAGGDFKRKWEEIRKNKVVVAVLLYLALHVIGLFWSEDLGAGMEMFKKLWKLAMLPIFLTSLAEEHRERVINFFLAGLAAMMVMTYLAWFDLVHYGGVTPEHPTRKLFHVVYNPMLAFGFYLVMHKVFWGEKAVPRRIGLSILALLMALNMFITEGRAGQVAFFALIAILLLQYFRKRIVWGIVLSVVILPGLFAAGYKYSPTFHDRVSSAWEETTHFRQNQHKSIGLRLRFWKNSWDIIKENPLVGVGTNDFKKAYADINSLTSPWAVATDNPHNQYILVLCQLGVLGLTFLLGIFFMQIHQALTGDDQFKRVRLAFPLFFLLIMLAESYLIVFESAFLFSMFTAVLYKEGGT